MIKAVGYVLAALVLPPVGIAFGLMWEGDWFDLPWDVAFDKWALRTGILYSFLLVGLLIAGWDRITSSASRRAESPSPAGPPG